MCICIILCVATFSDCKGNLQPLAFVQYGFDRKEHPIDIKPHGNSKKRHSFRRTKPSTLKLVKKAVEENKRPLKVLREVENIQGGILNAKSGCDLPRNRRQIYNAKQANKTRAETIPNSAPRQDTLAQVMQMCKDTSGTDAFIRSVEAAPEPMCVLATNQQLADLERFCTSSPSSVLSVDPTFNLGPFYVTPTTYHNLLVKTSGGNHPVTLGPTLIHQTKTFQPFHYFASTLIRLNPNLVNLKAFGTDGEPELIKAFGVCFPHAVHLRCTIHMRQNVKDKLRSLSVPQSVASEFLDDIFGKQTGSHFEAGLVDAESEASFRTALSNVQCRWNNLERSCIPSSSEPQFHAWFCKYKAEDIINCVLPDVRSRAGVDPGHLFTTNSSEAINHVIKQEVKWKECKLPQLISHLKAITAQHQAELEKAIVGRGEWHFCQQYATLQISESVWLTKMAPEAKTRHLKKVHSCQLKQILPQMTATTHENTKQPHIAHLSVSVENAGLSMISYSTLSSMWNKAEKLVLSEGHILKVPWLSDEKARLIKSSSSPQPHVVQPKSSNRHHYICDSN